MVWICLESLSQEIVKHGSKDSPKGRSKGGVLKIGGLFLAG